MPTKSRLNQSRSLAFDRQQGRCCYCGFAMWREAPKDFARQHGLSEAQARYFQCTAEHLVARKDGGSDDNANIAAACFLCNKRRHQRKRPPEPEQYKILVQNRLRKGAWHTFLPALSFDKPVTLGAAAGVQ